MAKFKMVPQRFLAKQALLAFRNLVENYDGDVMDDDFFDLAEVGFDHESAVTLVKDCFVDSELDDMTHRRTRYGRLDFSERIQDIFKFLWNRDGARQRCKAILRGICNYELRDLGECDRSDLARSRFSKLKRAFKLSEIECSIMIVAYALRQTCLTWPCRMAPREQPLLYAMALNRSLEEVLPALAGDGRLRKFGVLNQNFEFNSIDFSGFMNGSDSEAVERRFYKKCKDSNLLPWEFFGERATHDGETIKRIVAAGEPCNILLYGAPGTGKTSFAHSLVRELGRTGFEIRQGAADNKNMRAEIRFSGLYMCNEQEDEKTSIVIVDEADELLRTRAQATPPFATGGGRSTEKGVLNAVLDGIKIPTIWICNAPARAIDESVRRRFDYSVRFDRLGHPQRVSIWRNLVTKLGLSCLVNEGRIERYAAEYETSAGGISTVLSNLKRMKPTFREVDDIVATLMKPHCELMEVKPSNSSLLARGYSLDGLNIKGMPLEDVVQSVRNFLDPVYRAAGADIPRMNILLYGPPGTGKTEFVKFLGKELDRRVLPFRGSDILDCYVGESEKNIAEAFRRAEAEHAILFLDEVDGLLQDRTGANHNWEITQVNELLQQMESFGGVMVAATNFAEGLDAAVMRRFTFKLEFGYLDDEGKRTFFERMFQAKLSEEELAELSEIRNLTPGDFRTVRQAQFFLGAKASNATRITALKDECAHKKDGMRPATIGFSG